jgi:hypothetical protein
VQWIPAPLDSQARLTNCCGGPASALTSLRDEQQREAEASRRDGNLGARDVVFPIGALAVSF